MRARAIMGIVAAGWLLAGCFSPSYPENLACDMDGWCPPGQACNAANVCVLASGGNDAGFADGGIGPDSSPDALEGLGQLVGISIGDDVVLEVGQTHQFPLIGIYENGMEPITEFAIWESTDNNVMFVDFMGVAHAQGSGTATATARYNGRVDTALVTVN